MSGALPCGAASGSNVPCFRPVTVWVPLAGGPISFRELKNCRETKIPCRYCIGCRLTRQQSWALRCYCESRMHSRNAFITLTYDNDHLPPGGTLDYQHPQKFIRAVRQKLGKFRYFIAGEYGEALQRPHYHLLGFGLDIPDRTRSNSMYSREPLYVSDTLAKLWPHGHHSIGELTYASAAYSASYVLHAHRRTGPDDHHYRRHDPGTGETWDVRPEFARMSLKPGIGASWLRQYHPECFAHDGIVHAGKIRPLPQYFDTLLELIDPDQFDDAQYKRVQSAALKSADQTPERLAVREFCAKARSNFEKEKRL